MTGPALAVLATRLVAPSAFTPVTPAAPIVVPVAVVVEAGSPWDAPGKVESTLGKASAIFARCGLTLGDATVQSVRWSPEALALLNKEDPYKAPAQALVLDASTPASRPAIFLFGPGTVPATAKAFNLSSMGAFSRFPESKRMLNTTWITWEHEVRKAPDVAASYSTLAHELTHLFGDLGHTLDAPNLMSDADTPGAKSGDLSVEQCAAVRKRVGL